MSRGGSLSGQRLFCVSCVRNEVRYRVDFGEGGAQLVVCDDCLPRVVEGAARRVVDDCAKPDTVGLQITIVVTCIAQREVRHEPPPGALPPSRRSPWGSEPRGNR